MPARTELDRLAAARPPLLDHTELVVDPVAEDQILQHILGRPPARTRGDRSRAVRPATAIAAAAAVVVVAVAGVLVRSAADHASAPARRTAQPPSAAAAHLPSVAVMAARAEAAVAAISRAGILYVRTTYAPGTTTGGVAILETWTRGNWDREKLFSADGRLLDDVSAVIARGQRVRRFVDYQTRTWQTDSIALGKFGQDPSASETVAENFRPVKPRRLPGELRQDYPSRTISAVRVQGKPMILITFRYPRPLGGSGAGIHSSPSLPPDLPMLGATEELPGSAGNAGASTTMIWFDATTYLPVRAEAATAAGSILGSESYRWLSDSPANRAVLAPAPVPAGFRLTAELAH